MDFSFLKSKPSASGICELADIVKSCVVSHMVKDSWLRMICLCSQDLNIADCRESVDSSAVLIFGGYI